MFDCIEWNVQGVAISTICRQTFVKKANDKDLLFFTVHFFCNELVVIQASPRPRRVAILNKRVITQHKSLTNAARCVRLNALYPNKIRTTKINSPGEKRPSITAPYQQQHGCLFPLWLFLRVLIP